MDLEVKTVKFHNVLKCLIYTIFHIINNQYYFIIHTIHNSGMALTVSCEVNLSENIGKGEKVIKPFACRYCPLTSKRRYNIRIHEERKHGRVFSSPYCNYESKDSPNMRKHLKMYHSEMTQTDDNNLSEKEEPEFTCEICSKSFNRKDNMQRHVKEVHYGMKGHVKYPLHEKMDNENVSEENKYIEAFLNKVKTDFERKRELGKMAMEMIDKYELNVHGIPQEIKNAIKFNLMMEGK